MIGSVIFADSTKILVKSDKKVVQLNINEHSKKIKYQDEIEFDGVMVVSKNGQRTVTICDPTQVEVLKKAFRPKKNNPTTAKKEQQIAAPTEPEEKTVRYALSEDQSKFLIPAGSSGKYSKGNIIEKFGRLIEVSHIGKGFSFKSNKSPNSKKSRFNEGEQVCYVYYYKKEPVFSAEEFLQATKDYYGFIAHIKKYGIKPRHKATEVAEIKKSKAYCDSRLKIEGNSWIAVNSEYLWYVTHKLSPITIDNNMKINNQFAQCWRMSLHQISNKIPELEKIDLVLFKSSAIPNAQEDEEEEELI